jgi:primase-polymerase (primpol)-like protein
MPIGELSPAISLIVENVPASLAERDQWICWRYEIRGGQTTKIPYIPGRDRRASTTDNMTWRSLDGALNAYQRQEPPYAGIGFVFSSGDPFVGVDIDSCRNPQSGALEPWAKKIVEKFKPVAYVEASPSGCGVHIILEGTLERAVKTKSVEVYSEKRFFTISGGAL